MTTWDFFVYFALAAAVLWLLGAYAAWKGRGRIASSFTIAGLSVFLSYILWLWISLEHPPLRTIGETRLWYSLFMPTTGLLVYIRWRCKWILTFSAVMAIVFILVNLFKPEIHSKTLMPALQSPWFAPHVIVYMFAYALLGGATLMSVWLLGFKKFPYADREMEITDNLVYSGLAFLTFGMLFGALWAKEAWGHYWSWDPKETWAAVTWLLYLTYIHFRACRPLSIRPALAILLLGFVVLQVCWWGINYLPSARGVSVHIYG